MTKYKALAREMTKYKALALPLVVTACFLAALIWWEMSLWDECRQTNSFWYCVRILSR